MSLETTHKKEAWMTTFMPNKVKLEEKEHLAGQGIWEQLQPH